MSMARLRREVEPTDPEVLARFLPQWQRIDRPDQPPGPDALRDAISGLQGIALPAAQWEAETFPRRLGSYSPAWLDQLAAAGEITWVGAGRMGSGGGGRVAIYLREDAGVFGPPPADAAPEGEAAERIRAALAMGAQFMEDLLDASGAPRDEAVAALWHLVWAGEVTNDLWSPLRAGPRAAGQQRPQSPRIGRGGRTWGRSRTARASRTAAISTNSRVLVGTHRMRHVAPGRCPERPARCTSRAIPFGEPICTTRSTGEKSTPRSRLEVATTMRSDPSLSPASTRSRSSRSSDP
jgi:ATP-dependent Lhr-like helicase